MWLLFPMKQQWIKVMGGKQPAVSSVLSDHKYSLQTYCERSHCEANSCTDQRKLWKHRKRLESFLLLVSVWWKCFYMWKQILTVDCVTQQRVRDLLLWFNEGTTCWWVIHHNTECVCVWGCVLIGWQHISSTSSPPPPLSLMFELMSLAL